MHSVIECRLLTKSISKIVLQNSQGSFFAYQAGQYLNVVHHDLVFSPLSIACAPNTDNRIELHLAHPNENKLALDILRMAQQEKKLTIEGPHGICTAQSLQLDKPIIFLARGTGFAPIKAVIESLQHQKNLPAMHLYWSAACEDDLYLQDLAYDWVKNVNSFSFTPILSRVNSNWKGRVGKLQDVIVADYPDLSGYQIFASAPFDVIHEAWNVFLQHHLSRANYFSDMFKR